MYEYLFERGQLIRDPSPNQYSRAVLSRANYPIQYPTPVEEDLSSEQLDSLVVYNRRYPEAACWIGYKHCSFASEHEVALFTERTGISWV